MARPEARRKPVTLSDVAAAAGVSQATASRCLNGSERTVNSQLREKVLAAARQLNYTANLSAQAVARGTSTTVALLVSDIADAYFSSMAASVMSAAEAEGLRVTIAVTERSVEREIELVRELRGRHARAVILAGSGYVDSVLRENLVRELTMFEETGGRVVLVSRTDLPFETVDLDNLGGAQRLASALVRLGYTSFRVLCGEKDLVLTRDRVEGFRRGLAEAGVGLPEDRITYSEFSWEGGLSAVQAMDDQTIADTRLLFAANDEMALGAIAGLRGRGIRVPEDVAVAGFDDIRSLRDVVPSLTTVHVPLAEVGREAIARIVASAEHDRSKVVVATVQLRESTPRLN